MCACSPAIDWLYALCACLSAERSLFNTTWGHIVYSLFIGVTNFSVCPLASIREVFWTGTFFLQLSNVSFQITKIKQNKYIFFCEKSYKHPKLSLYQCENLFLVRRYQYNPDFTSSASHQHHPVITNSTYFLHRPVLVFVVRFGYLLTKGNTFGEFFLFVCLGKL